jgi:predicted metal-dependent phosphoesterase TrpH
MFGRADLHVHTTWSDGVQHPGIIVRAAAGSLDVVAITDHDQIGGALAARAFAARRPEVGVEVVAGEEISSRNGHLISLYLEERVPSGLCSAASLCNVEWMLPSPSAATPTTCGTSAAP